MTAAVQSCLSRAISRCHLRVFRQCRFLHRRFAAGAFGLIVKYDATIHGTIDVSSLPLTAVSRRGHKRSASMQCALPFTDVAALLSCVVIDCRQFGPRIHLLLVSISEAARSRRAQPTPATVPPRDANITSLPRTITCTCRLLRRYDHAQH